MSLSERDIYEDSCLLISFDVAQRTLLLSLMLRASMLRTIRCNKHSCPSYRCCATFNVALIDVADVAPIDVAQRTMLLSLMLRALMLRTVGCDKDSCLSDRCCATYNVVLIDAARIDVAHHTM